jgi:RNA polymerase sigma factor (sigma-70 family)
VSRRFEELFRHHSYKFFSFIQRRIDDADEAEDILQELFARAAEKLNSLAPIENLTAWLWTAVRNRIVDFYRSREHRRECEGESPGAERVLNPEDLL